MSFLNMPLFSNMPRSLNKPRGPNKPLHLTSLAAAVLVLLALAPSGASAQERRVPTSPNELRLSYAPVVQRAAPAVVNVYAAKTVSVSMRNPLFDDPIFRRFFGMPGMPGGPGEQLPEVGAGCFVWHAIGDCRHDEWSEPWRCGGAAGGLHGNHRFPSIAFLSSAAATSPL